MGCAGCGQKYRGLNKSVRPVSASRAIPVSAKRPLFKKGRRIVYEEERTPKLAVDPVEEVVTTPAGDEVPAEAVEVPTEEVVSEESETV